MQEASMEANSIHFPLSYLLLQPTHGTACERNEKTSFSRTLSECTSSPLSRHWNL